MLSGSTVLLITRQLGETFQQLASKRYLLQIRIRNLVLCLYPRCGLRAGVILKPAVRVTHFHTEVFILLQPLSLQHRSGHDCHTYQYNFLHVYMKILVRIQNLLQEIKIVEVVVVEGIPLSRFYARIIIDEILIGGTVAVG